METIIDYEKINNMKIERRIFFIAIASILTNYENEPFFCRETIREENWKDNDEEDTYGTVVYRTYTIEKTEEIVLNHEFVACQKGSNRYHNYFADNLDKYIPYPEIEPYFSLLIDRYPYLSSFIKRLLEICYENYGELPLGSVIELEQEYLSNSDNTKRKLTK